MWNCDWGSFGGRMMGFGFSPMGAIFWLILIIIVFYALYRIIGFSKSGPYTNSDKKDSLEILKMRLAKGEISLEEYEKLHEVLIR